MRSMLAALLLASIGAAAQDTVSRFAPFNGTRVHYESYGEGNEALVFIHGWTCDLTFWRAQEPVYSSHRSLLIDLPGHGASSKPSIPYPSDYLARGVEAAMRDAGVDRAILVGHSLGGPITNAFLRLFPGKVKAVVLVDAYIAPPPAKAPAFEPAVPPAQSARLAAKARSLQGPKGRKKFEREIEAMFSEHTPEALREEIRAKMLATPEPVRVSAVTSPSRLGPMKPGTTYPVPAIAILSGSTIADVRYRLMKTLFPSLQLDKWEGYGHFLMMEDPERFNRTLEAFLGGIK